ncbi:MAG: hemolysin family protein [Synergistaceae bacterium]|nr:hemolysin family protein [Synergistaceae bacterium]
MNSDLVGSIGLLLLFLVLSFFFSSTETAITAAGKVKLKVMENAHPNRKNGFAWLSDNVQRALSITLVGNNIVNIAASAVATVMFSRFFGSNHGPFIAILTMTTVVVIFCEILPKNIAIAHKEPVLYHSLPILFFFNLILWPVVWCVQHSVWFIGRIAGLRLDTLSTFVTREDLEVMVNASGESGAIEEGERKMISGVIAFEETRVSEVMVARTDMMAIPADTTVARASEIFLESGHSRIPVYEKELDKITGVLYVKDLLGPLSRGTLDVSVTEVQRKTLFIPETIKTDEAFELMKKSRTHIAIVVDEYGGTAGLVTLEDLLEEIVGDIQDEYDNETPDVLEESEGVYLVQGYVNLDELSETLRYSFEFDDVDTVAGMLLSLKGNFPEEGESVSFGPWRISAVEVVDHRILQVRVEFVTAGDEPVQDEPPEGGKNPRASG